MERKGTQQENQQEQEHEVVMMFEPPSPSPLPLLPINADADPNPNPNSIPDQNSIPDPDPNPNADKASLAHDSAIETVESARSSRSGSIYDETPPGMDVRVDDDDAGSDEGLGGGNSRPGSTFTAESSIFEFVEENGRTYHKYSDGKYILPNDEEELDRLDFQHHLWNITLKDQLFLAPIKDKDLQHVLDLGCGTGIWAMNFADKYPQAMVVGTDLSPVQPQWVPPNLLFEISDMEHPWTFSTPFSFIHARMLFTCLTPESTKTIFQSAYDHLAPGGWIELQDCIFPQKCIDASSVNTSLSLWNSLCVEASHNLGRPWDCVQNWKGWLEETGFEEVKEEVFLWPIGTWPKDKQLKELGMWFREDVLSVLEATGRLLRKGLGWKEEEVLVLLAGVRDDVKNRKVHMFEEVRIIYGRKPLE